MATTAEPDHVRADEVAESQIALDVVDGQVLFAAREGAGRQLVQRVDQQSVDAFGNVTEFVGQDRLGQGVVVKSCNRRRSR